MVKSYVVMSLSEIRAGFLRWVKRYYRALRVSISKRISGVQFEQDWKPWMPNWVGDVLLTYKLLELKKRNPNRLIVYITPDTEMSGLADRLRTMRTAYVFAVENNLEFYIYHNNGFLLEDYFEPNEIDWRIRKEDIGKGLNRVEFRFLYDKLEKISTHNKELHLHKAMRNINEGFLPDCLRSKYSDASVYRKLFKLSTKLHNMVDGIMRRHGIVENEYVVVHARFTNFFEKVEMHGMVTSTAQERALMLKRLTKTLFKIHDQTGMPIVLFSDSNTFLQYPHAEFVSVLPGSVSHLSNSTESVNYIDKTFVDLVVMSRGTQIFSLRGENIYGGGFSLDASFLGNKPFIRFDVADDDDEES